MGFIGNLIKAPFKAVGDVVGGAFKATFGTAFKALSTVLDAGFKFVTFRWGDAARTLAKGTVDTFKTFAGGVGQAARGSLMLGGTALAAGMAMTGVGAVPAVGVYAASTGIYTALGG
jgi:hypothetical protein